MNKQILTAIGFAFALTLSAPTAYAAGTNYGSTQCQPIYGGGDSCVKTPQFEINKTVQNPQTQSYVDNLTVSDAKFKSDEVVTFKITVKNTSNEKLGNVVVTDTLPEFVEFVSGVGSFDSKTKVLTINLDKLEANESRDFFIKAKVVSANKLPSDQSVMCVINQAVATVNDKKAQDNAQFCVEKSVVPTETPNPGVTKGGLKVFPPTTASSTPNTGSESLALIGLIPSALGGLALRRKSK